MLGQSVHSIAQQKMTFVWVSLTLTLSKSIKRLKASPRRKKACAVVELCSELWHASLWALTCGLFEEHIAVLQFQYYAWEMPIQINMFPLRWRLLQPAVSVYRDFAWTTEKKVVINEIISLWAVTFKLSKSVDMMQAYILFKLCWGICSNSHQNGLDSPPLFGDMLCRRLSSWRFPAKTHYQNPTPYRQNNGL